MIDGTITEDPSFALRIRGGLNGRFTTARGDSEPDPETAQQERATSTAYSLPDQ
jgi:hypothetical protein